MTAKRDLKKRVRARQASTGERYATARARVLGTRPTSGVPVIEAVDVSASAAAAGLTGRIFVFSGLADHVDLRKLLQRIRDALAATEDDPATDLLRAFLLHGRQPPSPERPSLQWLAERHRFLVRARAGIAGVSEGGRALALSVEGKRGVETVVCLLWGGPIAGVPGNPACMIGRPEDLWLGNDIPDDLWLLQLAVTRTP